MTAGCSPAGPWLRMRGFPGDLEVHAPAAVVKQSSFLLEKQKQSTFAQTHPCEAVLPPDLIFPITPSAHKSLHPLQRTWRVFGDRLCWVTEQKMLNYLHKWPARTTVFPFGPRMCYMTSFCSASPAPSVWFTLISK